MTAVDDIKELTSIPLFAGLSEENLTEMNQLLHKRKFPAGKNIMTVDQPGETVYLLLNGSVKIYVDQLDGSEVILAFLGPGATFGELSLVDSLGRSASVVTLEDCNCLAMDRSSFHRCLKSVPDLSYNLVRLLSQRLRLANEQIQALSTLDVRGRVARQLVAFAEQYGQPAEADGIRIPLRLTQTDVAALVGASRERVNQVIVDFKGSGFITVDPSHYFTVLDQDALIGRCQ
ncbi:MAG: Crp/Fnr family transcriptional regulator [Thermoanaerobaculia bacterium]